MKFSKYNLLIHGDYEETIIYNTLSGNIIKVNAKIATAFANKEIDLLDESTMLMCTQYGFIRNDNYDEDKIINYYQNKIKFDSIAFNATILLTWACNFKCIYCYEGAGEKISSAMPIVTANAVIAFIKKEAEYRQCKYINLCLFGGEPLLNINIGFYILDAVKQYCDNTGRHLSCGMITNGSLLTKDILYELNHYNCNFIQITIDGLPETHNSRRISKAGEGTFQKVLDGILLTDKHEPRIQCAIRINIDRNNIDEVEQVMKLLRDCGIENSFIDFGIVHSSTNACSSYSNNCFAELDLGDILDKLWHMAEDYKFSKYPKPKLKFLYCGLLNDSNFTIAPTGEIYKCWEMVGDKCHKIGDIDKEGNLYNLQLAFFDWMSINSINNTDCNECVYLPVCGGGCVMKSFNTFGNYHQKGCSKVKGVIEKQIIDYINKHDSARNNHYV